MPPMLLSPNQYRLLVALRPTLPMSKLTKFGRQPYPHYRAHGAGSPMWTGRTSLPIPPAPARLVESVESAASMASVELVLTRYHVRVVGFPDLDHFAALEIRTSQLDRWATEPEQCSVPPAAGERDHGVGGVESPAARGQSMKWCATQFAKLVRREPWMPQCSLGQLTAAHCRAASQQVVFDPISETSMVVTR